MVVFSSDLLSYLKGEGWSELLRCALEEGVTMTSVGLFEVAQGLNKVNFKDLQSKLESNGIKVQMVDADLIARADGFRLSGCSLEVAVGLALAVRDRVGVLCSDRKVLSLSLKRPEMISLI